MSSRTIDQLKSISHRLPAGGVEFASESSALYCELTSGHAFIPERNGPPVPVLAAFGVGSLHQFRLGGAWDWDRVVADHPDQLARSFRRRLGKSGKTIWEDLIFRFGERKFLCGDAQRIVTYCETAGEAEQFAEEFTTSYGITPPAEGGSFQLIRKDRFDFHTEVVTLDSATVLSDEDLELRYPDGALEWHRHFVAKLLEQKSGLSIIEGTPGTGKTSYLRHLMGSLCDTHSFYFIPPSSMRILSEPDFIGFWAGERTNNAERKLTVILEDADAAVMSRGADNREQVSALLNLTDGMLGDFLALQIICTINCKASEIDQALLRPGRLLTHRVFERLPADKARRLAASLGHPLPDLEDFSLAEVFAGQRSEVPAARTVGFGR